MNYDVLTSSRTFEKALQKDSFRAVPDSWFLIITDITGSTLAIEEGKYKEVNTAGGLAIMAVTNAFRNMQFPFIFGGDGVTMLLPESTIDLARDVLVDTRLKVQEFFGLDLRTGVVPVAALYKKDLPLEYGKLTISHYYDQAVLRGKGVEIAEEWVKAPNSPFLLKEKKDPEVEADFSGFTCRWEDIKSPRDETIALIVKAREENTIDEEGYYGFLLKKIDELIGDIENHHPIKEKFLNPSTGRNYLKNEAMARTGQKRGLRFFLKLLSIRLQVVIVSLAIRYQIKLKAYWYNLNDLKKYQIISSDYRKYDGSLKMVVAVTESTRKELEKFLQEEYLKNNIFYGIHVSDRALMTCLLHSESEREVHFIDAADGGYALAARSLKKQIRESGSKQSE